MKSINLDQWKFHYQDCPDAWYKGYDDTEWERVTVPHDWSVHMPFSREYSSGTGYLAGGTGWYRTTFSLPEELKGKRIFITFDGVYKNSQVWCNSFYLGKRPYGYTTFRYDITEQVAFDNTPNQISVKVSHEDIADSRWFTGSGITRKVTITAEEAVHADFNGIYFQTPNVSKEKATVLVTNDIVNHLEKEIKAVVENKLYLDGKEVLTMQSKITIPPGTSTTINNSSILHNPKLWTIDTPSLYKLTTIIQGKTEDGYALYEEYSRWVGIRSFRFDVDKGFFLNDIPMKLKGVCVHHDAGCLGAAVPPSIWYRRLLLLKEMGCNAIRMSHNPHMPELYDLCDALGFLVIDEAFDEWEGAKNKWSIGHNVYPPKHQGYYEDFPEWHERDLTDLINRDRNHPSIIMWSIGNEIDYPNDPYCHPLFSSMTGNNDKNKPAAERQYNSNKPSAQRLSVLAKMLTSIVKKSDITRPVSAAVAFPELSTQIGFIDSLDVVGYNYKEEYYEKDHERFPGKPFIGSENGHSYSAWMAVLDLAYISGQFLWTGIDYLGEAAGWPVRGSGAGLLTTAGFKKTSYFRRKSMWVTTPYLYLTTARVTQNLETIDDEFKPMYRSYNYIPGEMIEVRCYTNLPSVKLFCNEKELGEKEFDKEKGYISWIYSYEIGTLTAEGVCKEANQIYKDMILVTGGACDINMQVWKPNITELTLNKEFLDNIDTQIKQIEVTVTDALGNHVTNDSTMLLVEVINGTLIGLENGDLTDCTDYSLPMRRAFEGHLLIYCFTKEGATTKVKVSGNGLPIRELIL